MAQCFGEFATQCVHFGTGCACGDYTCIWRAADWPAWRYDLAALAGFEGKLTSSKWAAIAKCSPDTALRDVNALLARGVLRKSDAGGRSTSYELNDFH